MTLAGTVGLAVLQLAGIDKFAIKEFFALGQSAINEPALQNAAEVRFGRFPESSQNHVGSCNRIFHRTPSVHHTGLPRSRVDGICLNGCPSLAFEFAFAKPPLQNDVQAVVKFDGC